jgi:ubiquinone/menaquinone biosynthesis C-methylase UbiE
MEAKTHENLVVTQFGPRAAAYVNSVTHSQGEDLRDLAAMMRGRRETRVLDLGCGGGHAAFAVASAVSEVVAFDLSREMVDAVAVEARRRGLDNVTTRQGAVEALPFADGEFDVVMTRFSMHHWTDLGVALAQARRVVKADGHAVFIDTVSPGEPALDTFLQAFELLRDPSHVRNYSLAEFRLALAAAGFEIVATTERRMPIAFGPWLERMNTPAVQAEAIRALQRLVAAPARRHFAIAEDGSFELDTAMIEARPV